MIIKPIKVLAYQALGLGIIWIGMAFFFQDMDQTGKFVFYVATSWLLFLLVTLVGQLIKRRKNHNSDSTIEGD